MVSRECNERSFLEKLSDLSNLRDASQPLLAPLSLFGDVLHGETYSNYISFSIEMKFLGKFMSWDSKAYL